MKKLPDHLVGADANLSGLGIEHLIAIGGDDTLSYAARLDELGVKIIAISKMMDNKEGGISFISTALYCMLISIGSLKSRNWVFGNRRF